MLTSHSLAKPALPDAGLLQDVVRFKSMADGLVEQDAAEPVGQHDRHAAGRRRDGVKHDEGPLRCPGCQFGDLLLREVLQAALEREGLPAHLQECAPPGHDVHGEHLADAVVGVARAVRVGDPDTLSGLPVHRRDLTDLTGKAAGRVVGEAQ